MPDLKFVDELPPDGREQTRHGRLTPLVEKLRANPGQWAEIDRYPRGRRTSAASRGNQICKRYEGIEYAVRTSGEESALFLRAVAR